MLVIALALSSILLLFANLFVWKAKQPVAKVVTISALLGLGPIGVGLFLPPVLLQAGLLSVIVLLWAARHGRPSVFCLFSCTATLGVYGVLGFVAYQETKHLQEEFAYISMEDRLSPPRLPRPAPSLPPVAAKQLTELEDCLEGGETESMHKIRVRVLQQIHEETVQVFVNQQGFGMGRMTGMRDYFLHRGVRRAPPIPQPGIHSPSPWLPELLETQPDTWPMPEDLLSIHQASVRDFVNPAGFGYIKDRRHVAGFQEHQVSKVPAPERWTLQTLDLVGLVVHEQPVVYVSQHLPRMDELRRAPTRHLDEFETAGLLALRRGEDLFVRDRAPERRMLGAVRAAHQCLSCHDGQRGDLLGAFSYTLRSDQCQNSPARR